MKITISVFCLILLLTGFKCKNPPIYKQYGFDIRNNSNNSIKYYVAALGMEHIYPDTALLSSNPPMVTIPMGESRFWGVGFKLEVLFDQLPVDTLSVYLFNVDTLNKYPWSVIRDNYKVIKRYDLSLPDLKKRNFIVTYP